MRESKKRRQRRNRQYRMLILLVFCVMICVVASEGFLSSYKKGIRKLENGDYSKAIEAFEKSIEKEKHVADSYRGLGIALWESESYEAAYQAFENAMENGTEKTATIYTLLANCAMQLNSFEEACGYYEKAYSTYTCSCI